MTMSTEAVSQSVPAVRREAAGTAERPRASLPLSSPYRHLLFLYGTLKRGENNYMTWLADPCHALFVGTAVTRWRLPFFVNLAPDYPGGSPCVLPMPVTESEWSAAEARRKGGGQGGWQAMTHHVEGELFLVTEAMRCWLDVLEDVRGGTYAALPVVVDNVQPPPSLLRTVHTNHGQESQPLHEFLVAPFRCATSEAGGRGGDDGVEAVMYYRMKDYPADWADAVPSSSTRLLSCFRAREVLSAYGPRFAGGIPVHLRGPAVVAALQRSLDALPAHLQPSTSTLHQRKRLAEVLGAQDGVEQETGALTTTEATTETTEAGCAAALDSALMTGGGEGGVARGGTAWSAPVGAVGVPLLPKPLVLFIIDGIGDSTYPELGGRTPLEVVAGVPPRHPKRVAGLPEPKRALQLGEEFAAPAEGPLPLDVCYRSDGINTIAAAGVSGLMDPYLSGCSCGSDTAHLSFFGYDPKVYYRGRGAYETLGTAVDSSESDGEEGEEGEEGERASDGSSRCKFVLDDEDVCFKSNFATFADPQEGGFGDENAELERLHAPLSGRPTDPNTKGQAAAAAAGGLPFNTNEALFVTHRRCDRDFTKEGPVLCRYLNGLRIHEDVHGTPFDYPHTLKVKYATEHRCGVALSGAKTLRVDGAKGTSESNVVGMLSDKISGTDCLKDGLFLKKCVPTIDEASDPAEYARAVYTCRLVEAASALITKKLKHHPINEARREHNRRLPAGGGGRKNVANLILFRGAAKKGWVPTFANRHGLNGFMVAPTCIIRGLGVCCGLDCKTVCPVCFPAHLGRLRAALQTRLDSARRHHRHRAAAASSSVAGGDEKEEDGEEEEVKRLSELLAELQSVNASNSALEGATGDYHSDLSVKVAAGLHALRLRCPWPLLHNANRAAAIATAGEYLRQRTTAPESVKAPTLTGGVAEALQRLQTHPRRDFLVVHVKGVDDAGHDGNALEKLRLIRESGNALQSLFRALPDGACACVIADHSTPLMVKDHCCEPVPVSVAVKRVRKVEAEAEAEAEAGEEQRAAGLPWPTLAEEAAAFRSRWQCERREKDGRGEEPAEESALTLGGRVFASAGELLLFLLDEKVSSEPVDAVAAYAEVGIARAGALGRFTGDELMDVMKRTQYFYHFM